MGTHWHDPPFALCHHKLLRCDVNRCGTLNVVLCTQHVLGVMQWSVALAVSEFRRRARVVGGVLEVVSHSL